MNNREEELYFLVHGIDPVTKEEVDAMLERRSFMKGGEGDWGEEIGRDPDRGGQGPAEE